MLTASVLSSLLWLVWPLVLLAVGYWVIRLAVRHALQDNDERRAAQGAQEQ
jgi:cytochrome c-type biogenesis protein CcmH/NrfF